MYYETITSGQHKQITAIANKHLRIAKRLKTETAYMNAERHGMEEIRRYCVAEDLPTLGDHMVRASMILTNERY